MKRLKLNTQIIALAIASGLTFAGCEAKELGADNSQYDMLSTVKDSSDDILSGITQTLDVNGEDFKLLVKYSTDEKEWRITSDKKINMEIQTLNLPSNKEVYIDNIHTDTSIVSTKVLFDGIKQDSMDDRIHNSLMFGFPIDDDTSYYGINEIEGENKEFITGYVYGYDGYSTGEIQEHRLFESDFLSQGVYGNKIDSIIDLIIIDTNTNETRAVSVPSVLLVEANNKITMSDGTVYEYDHEGKKRVLTR